MKKSVKTIAILTTGDEVVSGDILNKNVKLISTLLESQRMIVMRHLSVRDDSEEIIESLKWLSLTHDAIIITGGLGPTVDDLTTEVVATFAGLSLDFNHEVWIKIQEKYSLWNKQCLEINKKQAFFPKHVTLLPNLVGTAYGFYLQYQSTDLFVLPGPPKECMPMVENQIIKILSDNGFQCGDYRDNWFILGIGESTIASKLEPICQSEGLKVSFRAGFPYVEMKIFTPVEQYNTQPIKNAMKEWVVTKENMFFSNCFFNQNIATKMSFDVPKESHWVMDWLPNWQQYHGSHQIRIQSSNQHITIDYNGHKESFSLSAYQSNERIKSFCMEWICYHCLNTFDIISKQDK
ncbi:MAG: hypothetical protein CMF42_04595 [Legionellales bacterium]|nr:hypothetical protein [Legionellales bacterium]|tara:strand:- start:5358 stop:6404 length:1047 start_codon:yes stop_codon:yes gene_type:complete